MNICKVFVSVLVHTQTEPPCVRSLFLVRTRTNDMKKRRTMMTSPSRRKRKRRSGHKGSFEVDVVALAREAGDRESGERGEGVEQLRSPCRGRT